MTQLPFIKMHGAENDYIFFDGFSGPLPQDPARLALQVCDRHAAIGADGIILMVPPTDDTCDIEMRVWNADGSSAKMCGNGARCIAVWMQLQGRVVADCRIRVGQSLVTARGIRSDGHTGTATVDMGLAELLTMDVGQQLPLSDGQIVTVHRVRIGNPHAVVFVDELSDQLVRLAGAGIETHADLPERTNVEFVVDQGGHVFETRVWERGSGETRACGSGACAVVAAAVQARRAPREHPCEVNMPGGRLFVCQTTSGNLELSGPAEIAFTGVVEEYVEGFRSDK